MGLSERRENGMESMNEEKELLEHVMKLMAEHFGKNCEIVLMILWRLTTIQSSELKMGR